METTVIYDRESMKRYGQAVKAKVLKDILDMFMLHDEYVSSFVWEKIEARIQASMTNLEKTL